MQEILFKLSAIHNLVIDRTTGLNPATTFNEGLVIPNAILQKSDIRPYEQVIVARIKGNNLKNRIKTFVIPGQHPTSVEARGSLNFFLKKDDIICIISQTLLNKIEVEKYKKNLFPIFDLGYKPGKKNNNVKTSNLDIEFNNKKIKNCNNAAFHNNAMRSRLKRFYLSSLILDLEINNTNPNCLRGSAELPKDVMKKGGIKKYQSVSVYNSSRGGVADTYTIP